jgi:putative DNA primase/helicase
MRPQNINEILDLDTLAQQEYWGRILTSSQIMMVYAPTGVGKSFFVWSLLLALATGSRFLNQNCPKPVKVLLAEGEMGLAYTKKRLGKLLPSLPYSPRGENFRVLSKDHCGGQLWNISNPEHQKRYNALLENVDVLAIDNLLSSAFPMSAKDNEFAMWERIAPWLFMIRDSGRSVILVHHTNKGGQQQMGASTKMNWLDTAIELRPPAVERAIAGTEFELRFAKTRDVKKSDAQPISVQFVEDEDGNNHWIWSPIENSQVSEVKEMKAKGMSRREVAKQTGLSFQEVELAWGDINI